MAQHSLGSPLLNSGGVSKCRTKPTSHRARHSSSSSSPNTSLHSSLSGSPSSPCMEASAETSSYDENGTDDLSAQDSAHSECFQPPLSPDITFATPINVISKSNRRSSSLSQCMMKERISYRAMGRDKDGYLTYALHVEESQGFKWNRNLSRLNRGHFDADQSSSLLDSVLYDFSSDGGDDSDSDDGQTHETSLISN